MKEKSGDPLKKKNHAINEGIKKKKLQKKNKSKNRWTTNETSNKQNNQKELAYHQRSQAIKPATAEGKSKQANKVYKQRTDKQIKNKK